MNPRISGFTLIELAIVLVIIGLIVGGVLVGRDLIAAAAIRAQITQIEKLNTATNTFYEKFHALPGDLDPVAAAQYSLPAHQAMPGGMSNDGMIEGINYDDGSTNAQGGYETGEFWADLASSAGGRLVEGNFSGVRGMPAKYRLFTRCSIMRYGS